jgi:hypothetical protein
MEQMSPDKEVKNKLKRDQLRGEFPETKISIYSKYENSRTISGIPNLA